MNEIVTRRLRLLRPSMSPGSIEQHVQWLNDPEVTKYSEQRHKRHVVGIQKIYMQMLEEPHEYREIFAGGKMIGSITAHVDKPNGVADIGILLGDKAEWGKGYATEAWGALINHLFSKGIRKIEAGTMVANVGMTVVMSRCGMAYEGLKKNHFLLDGEPVHAVYFGRFNNESFTPNTPP